MLRVLWQLPVQYLVLISLFPQITWSLDSFHLDLEVLESIDLSPLGTPNLSKYQASYDLTVSGQGATCQYALTVQFIKPSSDEKGAASPNFQGFCAPNTGGGTAPDGLQWHAHRRHWMQFPDYVFQPTGFDHMSLNWRPCGLPPDGLRQARYDVNFYTVLPQYRVFWACRQFQTPRICRFNQTTTMGRSFFVLPRLERDPNFLANMPRDFQPDPKNPEAYAYEGLISYNKNNVPETPADWFLPTFHMSTYDGDVASWRALLPHHFISGSNSSFFHANQFYVFRNMARLPGFWNMTYDAPTGWITVVLIGEAGICAAKLAEERLAEETEEKSGLRG